MEPQRPESEPTGAPQGVQIYDRPAAADRPKWAVYAVGGVLVILMIALGLWMLL